MHRLTIDRADHRTTTSEHPDADDAKRALARYAEHTDCRTQTIQTHHDFSSWDLVTLADNRVHATASIEDGSTTGPSPSADLIALSALRDNARRVDTGLTVVDSYERAAAQRQSDKLTGASRHFDRAS